MIKSSYGDISRRDVVTLGSVIEKILSGTPVSKGLIENDVCHAWDRVCGLPQGAVKRSYNDGILYVTFSSSALRSMMYPSRDSIAARINAYLAANPRFAEIDTPVRRIVFR